MTCEAKVLCTARPGRTVRHKHDVFQKLELRGIKALLWLMKRDERTTVRRAAAMLRNTIAF